MIRLGTFELGSAVLQSAMAGCTDLAFRLIARAQGLELAYLEMISANALVYQAPKTAQLLKRSKEDAPLGVQIVGSDPAIMGEAAAMLEAMGFDLLDINCGCPVPKMLSKTAGCALLQEPDLAKKIFNEVVKRVKKIPVTVKMRTGFSDPSGAEALVLAKLAEEAGVHAVTVHGRTGKQGYSGKADWGIVAKVKKSLRIPVFGNGDIHSGEDAKRLMYESECDGVMIGRAALGNPWIYKDIEAALNGLEEPPTPTLAEKKNTILKHLDYVIKHYGEERGIKKFRSVACWYFKELPGVTRWRLFVNTITTEEVMRQAIHDFVNSLTQ